MALASLGTDTGGSIRIPAAACGVVGLKPTYGELPAEGVVPLSRTLDHVGPITRSVSDAWHVFHALLGHHAGRPLAATPTRGIRLALPRRYFCDILDDEVRARFEDSLDALRKSGVRIDETGIQHTNEIGPIYMIITFGDAAAYHARTLESVPERYTPGVRLRLQLARYVLAEDYVRALAGRETLRREVVAALAGHDALILPSLPIPAPLIGANSVQIGSSKEPIRGLMLRETQLFNLTGHPAISLPCGRTSSGLPCGLQLVGGLAQTEELMRVALSVERVLDSSPPLQAEV